MVSSGDPLKAKRKHREENDQLASIHIDNVQRLRTISVMIKTRAINSRLIHSVQANIIEIGYLSTKHLFDYVILFILTTGTNHSMVDIEIDG